MTLITTDALVLQTIPFRESSLIVRVFTREQGKISVIAKGARRMKSSLRGFLEPLNHIEIIYYYKSTRDIQILTKVHLVASYLSGNYDLENNAFGLALLETVDRVVHSHQHDHEIFDCSAEHLQQMDSTPDLSQLLYVRFLLSLTKILGYQIGVHQCFRCQKQLSDAVYDTDNAQLICMDCGRQFSPGHRIKENEMFFLKDPGNKATYPHINPNRLMRLLIHYLSYHLDIQLKLKSLQLLSDLNSYVSNV